MGSTNRFSSNSGTFVDLLTSQLVNEGYPEIVDLGSSELPRFSSQSSDDPAGGVDDRKERRKWSLKEDVVLISAWLNTSKDPIVANDQKAGAFWKRIETYYNASPQVGHAREGSQCKQRWGRINDQVCKFVGCYDAAMKEQTSSQNENDLMRAAHEIFQNDYQTRFTLDHAWRELRHDQKWSSTAFVKDGGKDKRRKLEDGSGQASNSPADDVSEARPPGVKAAKAAGKRIGMHKTGGKEEGKALADLQSVWEIRKLDFEMKEKMSRHKMLESLLAKTEALSEIEVALKNKLITEMML